MALILLPLAGRQKQPMENSDGAVRTNGVSLHFLSVPFLLRVVLSAADDGLMIDTAPTGQNTYCRFEGPYIISRVVLNTNKPSNNPEAR